MEGGGWASSTRWMQKYQSACMRVEIFFTNCMPYPSSEIYSFIECDDADHVMTGIIVSINWTTKAFQYRLILFLIIQDWEVPVNITPFTCNSSAERSTEHQRKGTTTRKSDMLHRFQSSYTWYMTWKHSIQKSGMKKTCLIYQWATFCWMNNLI